MENERKITSKIRKFDFRSIRSFEDACKALDMDPKTAMNFIVLPARHSKSMIAAFKLAIIAEALNDGWVPDWTNITQKKYYPSFVINHEGQSAGLITIHYEVAAANMRVKLFVDSPDKALYLGVKFRSLYRDFLLT